jgi:DNA-binding GntR family transcriptional regulator
MAKREKGKGGRPPLPDAQYRRIQEDLTEKIRTGEWPPGTVIPSHRALAMQYGVGLNTVRAALQALRAQASLQVNLKMRMVVVHQKSDVAVGERMILELMSVFIDDFNGNPNMRAMQQGIESVLGA